MGKLGWWYPEGCDGPPENYDEVCEVCGVVVGFCQCPECPVCYQIGDPDCYREHGLVRPEGANVTLGDFNPTSVWFTSVYIPQGMDIDLVYGEHPETGEAYLIELWDRKEMIPFGWDLKGTVRGLEWEWDGDGSPCDWNGSSVLRIKAFRD
jgi:hypothetical protein